MTQHLQVVAAAATAPAVVAAAAGAGAGAVAIAAAAAAAADTTIALCHLSSCFGLCVIVVIRSQLPGALFALTW